MADLVPLSDEELYGSPKAKAPTSTAPPTPSSERAPTESATVSPVVVEGKGPKRTLGGALVSAATHFIPDVANVAVETIVPLLPQNWWSTIKSTAQLGGGILQHLENTLPPEVRAKLPQFDTKTADAVGQYYKDKYGSWDNIKETLATHPASMLMDVSTVLMAPELIAAKAPGALGAAARAAGTAGRAIDPLANTLRVAGVAAKPIVTAGTKFAAPIGDVLKTTTETIKNTAKPFVAGVSTRAAERQAADTLRKRAPGIDAAVAAAPDVLVPGIKPTTAQQMVSPELGSLEAEVAKRSPQADAAFAARQAEQEQGRTAALTGIQSGGEPAKLAEGVQSVFSDLNTQAERSVTGARTAAEEAAASARTAATPEGLGEQLRAPLAKAEETARANEKAMWNAIDPEGKIVGDFSDLGQFSQKFVDELPEQTRKRLTADEKAFFADAQNLGGADGSMSAVPLSEALAFRAELNNAMAQELRTNGRTPTWGRLSRLRSAVEDSLTGAVSKTAEGEAAAVAAGKLSQEETVANRVNQWMEEWRTGATPDEGEISPALTKWAEERLGKTPEGAAPPEGMPYDEGAKQRLAEATQATKTRARTFGLGAVGNILRKGEASDLFKSPNSLVASTAFKRGATGFEDVSAVLKASPETLPLLQDAAAMSLRDWPGAMRADGTLNPRAFESWRLAHDDALRALPAETQTRFADAAKASDALVDAERGAADAIKAFQKSALGKFLDVADEQDVTSTIGRIMNSRTASRDLGALVDGVSTSKALSGDARRATMDGLRQAVADHIVNTFVTGAGEIKPDAFQSFVSTNRGALSKVFGPDEMNLLGNIAMDYQRAARSTAKAAPAEAQVSEMSKRVLAGAPLTIGLTGGWLGGLGAMFGIEAGATLFKRGIANVDDLLREALLHPEVAKELLERVPAKDTGALTKKAASVSNAIRVAGKTTYNAARLARLVSQTQPEKDTSMAPAGLKPLLSDDDLYGGGGSGNGPFKPPPPRSRVPKDTARLVYDLSPDEAKALAVVGEASPDESEMRGVAHVLANREKSPDRYGTSVYSMLTGGEFDAFKTEPEKLKDLMASDRYKQALQIVKDVNAGKDDDLTDGATHFLAPRLMQQKGYETPTWAKTGGLDLGQSRFFVVE
jgi:hypothetical protein